MSICWRERDSVYDESDASVTAWIHQLQTGDALAAQQLWDRYSQRLVELARLRLGNSPRRILDEEDVALGVFECLCRGASAGRFQNLRNRDDLWWLLLAITKRKAISQIRYITAKGRGGRRVRGESELGNGSDRSEFRFEDLVNDQPTPEFLATLKEQHQHLLGALRDDTLRRVAVWRIEGYSVEEIAEKLNVTTRTVTRKLALIREKWSKVLHDDAHSG